MERSCRVGGSRDKRRSAERQKKLMQELSRRGASLGGRSLDPVTAALGTGMQNLIGPPRGNSSKMGLSSGGGIPGGGIPGGGPSGRSAAEQWKKQAPRLAPRQQKRLAEIRDTAQSRWTEKPMSADTFVKIHRQMEREIADRSKNDKALKGLTVGLGWRIRLSGEGLRHLKAMRPEGNWHMDYDVPPESVYEFVEDEIFRDLMEHAGRVDPMVICYQHERAEDFLESSEEAIVMAERRRGRGEAYYTETDQALGGEAGKSVTGEER